MGAADIGLPYPQANQLARLVQTPGYYNIDVLKPPAETLERAARGRAYDLEVTLTLHYEPSEHGPHLTDWKTTPWREEPPTPRTCWDEAKRVFSHLRDADWHAVERLVDSLHDARSEVVWYEQHATELDS